MSFCEYPFRSYSLVAITKSLNAQKSANNSPFSFITSPSAPRPMVSSLPVLSAPSLAFMSPIRMNFDIAN
ncbi:unnamed protein product [Heterobilharzia americana]|nr:unnamed protein product [Heterobilharzia americana]